MASVPLDTSTQQCSTRARAEGLHVVDLFAVIGLGMLRAALAADYSIKCYTYVDKDIVNRRIAKSIISALMLQYCTAHCFRHPFL